MRAHSFPSSTAGVRSYRPWDFFETLTTGQRFQVKLLHVKPGERLSMKNALPPLRALGHSARYRQVTIGGIEKLVQEIESVYIKATHWHRLENLGKLPLEMIEVQIGSYLGEDDISHADVVYNRATDKTPTIIANRNTTSSSAISVHG